MATHASHDGHDDPALGLLVLTLVSLVFGLGIVAVQEWTPLAGGPERPAQALPAPASAPASACRECGVVESVRSMEQAEAIRRGITVRGVGDDLMSVLGLVAGALVGNRLRSEPSPAIHEITVRFGDGSSRILTSVGERAWERGDPVKVVHNRVYPNGR